MVPSRRRLLQCIAAAACGVAGCAGQNDTDEGTPTVPADTPERGQTVPPHVTVRRSDSDSPPVQLLPDGADSGDGEQPDRTRQRGLITTDGDAGRIRVVDDAEGATAARSFLQATSFDEETIYLDFHPVQACFRLELCHVRWSETDIETRYGEVIREADVECRADRRHGVSTLVRIPAALDADSVSGYGSGVGGGGCRRYRNERRNDDDRESIRVGPAPPNGSEPTTRPAAIGRRSTWGDRS
jgi:hypothetical protein